MFGIFKKKKDMKLDTIYAPCDGKIINIEDIPDVVFSEKMMGDGIAIDPTNGNIYAPFDGEIVQVFNTKHALVLKSKNNTKVLIHIGLDTVNLKGIPFDVKVKENQKISKGQLLVEVDLAFIKQNNLKTIIPIILINDDELKKIILKKNDKESINFKEELLIISE